ncbi:MAG: chromosome partitioning protein ParB, partial [Tannerella sp.]|nr:chromosome partitioning protein ParB [Tannerella sp.]
QVGLKDKRIDMGHARALIPVDDPEVQLALYEQILVQDLSVRNVEELVRNTTTDSDGNIRIPNAEMQKERRKLLPDEYKLLKDHLSMFFQTKVKLTYNDESGKGKISIPFNSEEELEKIMGLLDKMK